MGKCAREGCGEVGGEHGASPRGFLGARGLGVWASWEWEWGQGESHREHTAGTARLKGWAGVKEGSVDQERWIGLVWAAMQGKYWPGSWQSRRIGPQGVLRNTEWSSSYLSSGGRVWGWESRQRPGLRFAEQKSGMWEMLATFSLTFAFHKSLCPLLSPSEHLSSCFFSLSVL